jgi:acyl carrier protein
MNAGEIEPELTAVLSLILAAPITATSSRATNPTWVSLKHMQIIFAVEERFGVRFTEAEIPQMDSFFKLAERLRIAHAS